MKQIDYRTKTGSAAAAAGAVALLCAFSVPARAQEAPAPVTPAQEQQNTANARTRSLDTVISQISQAAGVAVVADSSVARLPVVPPAEPTTPENFTRQVEALVAQLGRGATWARLYLPAARSARGYNADALAEYAVAQAKLFGNVGGATPAGTIEVMGQNVPAERAESVIAALNLKPVYLVMNPQAQPGAGGDINARWNTMTETQRRAYASEQARQVLSMDPNARRQYFDQMRRQDTPERMIMQEMMRTMTPEQRQQFFQGMGGGRGPGGPGGGRRGGGGFGGPGGGVRR